MSSFFVKFALAFFTFETMAIETERKYLVTSSLYREMSRASLHIVQGYLSRTPERTVRVRIKGDKGFITVKGKTEGDTRLEFEYPVPLKDAEEMMSLCEGRIIEKTRYIVESDGFLWEIDEFSGELAPLVVAEIELPSSDAIYPLPPFIGTEVTGNPAYYNSNF